MLVDARPVQNEDTYTTARERLSIAPAPAWATPCQPDYAFTAPPAKNPPQVTPLLWSAQVNVEANATYFHLAIRLENMQAVQQQSQWRLEFEPRSQAVTLHSIKIRRGTTEIDHTSLDKIRLLQREAGLDGFVIDGLFTALLVLEDVRPGDVLEYCYTRQNLRSLLPDQRFSFLQFPTLVPIGKVYLTIFFDESRPLAWKSSGSNFQPEESRNEGVVTWRWIREKFAGGDLESNLPSWHLAFPWVQVSDCGDWGIVAKAILAAWSKVTDGASVADMVAEISQQESEPTLRIERAIRLVQDEFRYLSINLEHGGQIPSAPDATARRRFGDCKDLSVLLVQLLRGLGLAAHPVLVSSQMRRTIGNLLPSPNIFDHAIVQYEFQDEVCWIDPTIKNQGGGPLKRVLPNFAFGLVLDETTTKLVPPPAASVTPGTYRIRENILLDTTGSFSSVAVITTAEGREAENLRQQFAHLPLADIERQNLQHCANRYGHARRVGELTYRDDRDTNEFHIAEIFEVNGFLRPSAQPNCCDLLLPYNLMTALLRLPEEKVRKDPFALPQPGNFVHVFEINGRGFQHASPPKSRIESSLVRFSRQIRSMPGACVINLSLEIMDEAMMGNQYQEHATRVRQIWEDSLFKITLPFGNPAAARNRVFGNLPSPSIAAWKKPPPKPRPVPPPKADPGNSTPQQKLVAETTAEATPIQQPAAVPKAEILRFSKPGESQPHRHRRKKKAPSTMLIFGVVLLIIIILLIFTAAH